LLRRADSAASQQSGQTLPDRTASQRSGSQDFTQTGTPANQVVATTPTGIMTNAMGQLTLQDQQQLLQSVQPTQQQCVLLLRPFWKKSLHDRLHCRPFLKQAEKHYLAFQLLLAVNQLHKCGIPHLDIKSENVFIVNGSERLILSDIAYPFKPVFITERNPADFSFYFSSASFYYERRVFLAPERLRSGTEGDSRNKTSSGLEFALVSTTSSGSSSSKENAASTSQQSIYKNEDLYQQHFQQTLAPMDIFSAGCVLADLFLDGRSQLIVDLPELLQYRNNPKQFFEEILQPRLEKIQDTGSNNVFKNLIAQMVQADPRKRPTAFACLQQICSASSPLQQNFNVAGLHAFSTSVGLHPLLQHPDLWLCYLRQ
ncbi:unnamed protein product, partial [Amoebophrya sp. A120]